TDAILAKLERASLEETLSTAVLCLRDLALSLLKEQGRTICHPYFYTTTSNVHGTALPKVSPSLTGNAHHETAQN
uniref:hypothetical protein n=1 Tax=Gemmatimonas sp. TaxID=1962908 RepID=UPI003563B502